MSAWDDRSAPAPLQGVYVVQPDEDPDATVRVTPLPPREAFMALVGHSFRFDVRDRHRLRADTEYFSSLAREPIWFALRVPRRLGSLRSVRAALVA
jgi:hypothetical protein